MHAIPKYIESNPSKSISKNFETKFRHQSNRFGHACRLYRAQGACRPQLQLMATL